MSIMLFSKHSSGEAQPEFDKRRIAIKAKRARIANCPYYLAAKWQDDSAVRP
jgi:hypothetical protein